MGRFSERYGNAGIEEAVQAHPGIEAAKVLSQEIKVAESNGWDCDFTAAVRSVGKLSHDYTLPPWMTAQEFAQRLRSAIGIRSGLVQNKMLADAADIHPGALESATPDGGKQLEYGLRLKTDKPRSRLVFHTRAATSRRFELGRAIGDANATRTSSRLAARKRSRSCRFLQSPTHRR